MFLKSNKFRSFACFCDKFRTSFVQVSHVPYARRSFLVSSLAFLGRSASPHILGEHTAAKKTPSRPFERPAVRPSIRPPGIQNGRPNDLQAARRIDRRPGRPPDRPTNRPSIRPPVRLAVRPYVRPAARQIDRPSVRPTGRTFERPPARRSPAVRPAGRPSVWSAFLERDAARHIQDAHGPCRFPVV